MSFSTFLTVGGTDAKGAVAAAGIQHFTGYHLHYNQHPPEEFCPIISRTPKSLQTGRMESFDVQIHLLCHPSLWGVLRL
jgi:hypothetical protein